MDLRHFNAFSETPKFQYKSIATVYEQIPVHDGLVTLDIKKRISRHLNSSGPLKVPRHSVERPLVPMEGPSFQIQRPVIQYLCQQGLRLVSYVDNILLMAPPSEIKNHKQLLLDKLMCLRWLVNWEKSSRTSMHNGTVHHNDKSHCPWKAPSKKCISSAQSTIRLGFPTRAGQSHKGRLSMVVPHAGVLEWPTYQNKTSRGSTGDQCFTNRIGSGSQWKTGSRLLGLQGSTNALKLP